MKAKPWYHDDDSMNLPLGHVDELLGSHVANVYFRGNNAHNRAVLLMKLRYGRRKSAGRRPTCR